MDPLALAHHPDHRRLLAGKPRPGLDGRPSYRRLDGREVSKTFDRRTDAARWRREGLQARERGDYLDPRAGRVTVGQYRERWRAAQLHHRPSTRTQTDVVLRVHVYPHLGEVAMGRVLPGDVQALVKRWEDQGAAPSTIRHVRYAHLRAMFAAAVRDGVIPRTPCVGIRLPEVIVARPVPLAAAEVERLASAIDPRYRAMVLLGYGTGARISEARGLTVGCVDFLGREVAYIQQLGREVPYPLVPLKNSRRSPGRVVPAPAYVLEALAEHLRRYGPGERDLVFCSATGKPTAPPQVGLAFRAAARAVGLPEGSRSTRCGTPMPRKCSRRACRSWRSPS